jgi:hypothetical protein
MLLISLLTAAVLFLCRSTILMATTPLLLLVAEHTFPAAPFPSSIAKVH